MSGLVSDNIAYVNRTPPTDNLFVLCVCILYNVERIHGIIITDNFETRIEIHSQIRLHVNALRCAYCMY